MDYCLKLKRCRNNSIMFNSKASESDNSDIFEKSFEAQQFNPPTVSMIQAPSNLNPFIKTDPPTLFSTPQKSKEKERSSNKHKTNVLVYGSSSHHPRNNQFTNPFLPASTDKMECQTQEDREGSPFTMSLRLPSSWQENQIFNQHLLSTRKQIQSCWKVLAQSSHNARLLPTETPLTQVKGEEQYFKHEILELNRCFYFLKRKISEINHQQANLEEKESQIAEKLEQKVQGMRLSYYQSLCQTNLLTGVESELDLIEKEILSVIKPFYNSLKGNSNFVMRTPSQQEIQVSYRLLENLEEINQRLADALAIESEEGELSSFDVFEELLLYCEQVSSNVDSFKSKWQQVKAQLSSRFRHLSVSVSELGVAVEEKVKQKLKYYDLMKEVDAIADRKARKQKSVSRMRRLSP